MKHLLMESLAEFTSTKSAEAFLTYQNPPEDAETGPKPDGPMGWRACRNQLERVSGGKVFGFESVDTEDVSIGQAVDFALSTGAGILRIESEPADLNWLKSLVQRVPQLKSFMANGGRVMHGMDEINRDQKSSPAETSQPD